jgi:hypothetical protein
MPRSREAILRAKQRHNATGKPLLAAKRRRKGLRLAIVVAQHVAECAAEAVEEFTTKETT